jgi:hypothetical protein
VLGDGVVYLCDGHLLESVRGANVVGDLAHDGDHRGRVEL